MLHKYYRPDKLYISEPEQGHVCLEMKPDSRVTVFNNVIILASFPLLATKFSVRTKNEQKQSNKKEKKKHISHHIDWNY